MALEFRHAASHKQGKMLTIVYHSEVPEEVLRARCLSLSCQETQTVKGSRGTEAACVSAIHHISPRLAVAVLQPRLSAAQ